MKNANKQVFNELEAFIGTNSLSLNITFGGNF